jgi:Zn-dependent M16 (insulinase) family peptidase
MKEQPETRQPPVTLSTDEAVHGFRVQDVTPLAGIRSVAYRLIHEKSGARLLHLHTADEENLLAIAFRTPPPDDTGLPHILEHTVLCGSRKYPVKDPFVELLKTSLATFLNAMTYPDKTVYPCASMVEKDFFNLAGVYCDAVFHPLLTEAHFKQEGHHYGFLEPGNPDSRLIVKGVVYNEMKGAYSDLDGIIGRMTSRSICPDNAYGRDSGGDPDAIPSLTYPQFADFHRTFYHPSNSFIFLYGDIPTERHLAFLDEACLRGFTRIPVDTTITAQPRWFGPSYQTLRFPIGAHEDPSHKAATVVTFLTNDVTDALRSLSMNVIEYYLLGNAASPLRKALIDSKLGEELTSSGYADYQRDTYFTVGLKGCSADSTDAIVDLVVDTCARLVRQGFEKEKIESAFHRLELSSREIGSQYPLRLMDRVYRSWIYDADPLHNLRLNEHLAELRRRYASEERFFERQLAEMLVDNSHYSVLTFLPDKTYLARRQERFEEKMTRVKAEMETAALEKIAREAAELEAMQSAPNSPEAVATLPRLTLADIPAEPRELATEVFEVSGRPLLYTDIFSNGLNYLKIAFDLRGIDEELIDYLALYAEALTKMGAGEDDYVAMAEREAAATGGVSVGISADGHVDDPVRVQPFFTVSSKALDAKLPAMLDVIADRILRCDLTDIDRLRDVVLQGRVRRRSALIPAGNHFAATYAARKLSRNGAISERVGGITQVRFFDHIADHFDAMGEEIVEKLGRIQDFLLASGRVSASFVGDSGQFERTRDFFSTFLQKLRGETPPEAGGPFAPVSGTREGLATPADVAFVAQAFPAIAAAHADAPAVQLLCVQLSLGYLWEEIRMKRGAYGARAGYSPLNGVLSLSSYRDPFIKETLDAFSGVFRHVEYAVDLTPGAVEQAIIGTVKTLDRVIRPGQAVGLALGQHLCGETKEFRKAFRARLLALTGEDLRRVNAEILIPALKGAPVCVISSRERLAAANEAMGENGLTITDL